MDLKSWEKGYYISELLDKIRTFFLPIDVRWKVYLLSVFLIAVFLAIGTPGLAILFALSYIMYFVTFK